MLNTIINDDCLNALPKIPDKSINVIFSDLPFNIDYKYDKYSDSKSSEEYLGFINQCLAQSKRILKDDGSVFFCIGDEWMAQVKLEMDDWFHWRNSIIWHYSFGVNCKKKFARSHSYILYYTQSPTDFVFNADAIKIPSLRQTKYKDKRAAGSGKVPDDVWVFNPESDTWKISRVCGTFKERSSHPCQQPLELVERCIKVASNPGDTVLDFCMGSATTLCAAKRLGRNYIGIELSEEYCKIGEERLNATI